MSTVASTLEKKKPRLSSRLARGTGWFLLVVAALAVIVALLLLAADWSVRNEPVVSGSAVSRSSDFVTLQSDERLFTLMAALNAAGYDDENNPKGMHPVRQAVRARLAAMNLPSVARLRLQFRVHQSLYVTWLLQRGNPPAFNRLATGWWVQTAPPLLFWGLDSALRDLYREADIADLWQEFKPQYDAECARYQALATPAVEQLLAYLRVDDPPTARVVVLPNLLDAYWRGYGPRIGDTSFVVMGPAEEPNIGLIQHEAMHPIVNPLVDASLSAIDPKQTERLYALLRPRVPDSYASWDGILQESVIRAVEVRLIAPDQRERQIKQEEEQGFLLVRPLAARMEGYEKSQLPFAEYLPTLLSSLNGLALK